MKDINNNMDKVFRDRLGDYQQQPPEEIWNGIKSGLGGKPSRKILIPIWQVAAGAALLVTAGTLFFFLNRPSETIMAEQILPIPQNIRKSADQVSSVPEKGKTEINETPVYKSVTSVPEIKTEILPDNELHIAEPGNEMVTTENIQKSSPAASNSEINNTRVFTVAMMSDAFLSPVSSDKIPMNKKAFTASWDMLQASTEQFTEEDGENDRLLLTAQVSPTYSYRDIGNIGAISSDKYNEYESGRISYSGGLQFGYKTSERLSIHAGIMYAQLGYNINQVGSYSTNAIATSNEVLTSAEKVNSVYSVTNSIGTISPASGKEFIIEPSRDKNDESGFNETVTSVVPTEVKQAGKIEQYFQYLEVPFLLRYRIIDRKLGVNLVSGISTNILVGNHASLTIDNQTSKIGTSENVRDFNYLGNIGLGFDYIIRRNLLFTIEPQFKYFLNSINQSSLVNRPYMLGMFTGVRYTW